MLSYNHTHFTVHQIPALRDNYIYLLEASESNALIAIDPADASLVRTACRSLGKPLTHIFNTHHHWDHTDGNKALKQHFNCTVIGATRDAERIPAIDITVDEQTPPEIKGVHCRVLELDGHTMGHIALLVDDALFCGDTLFGAGCGRIFEGSPAEMWKSLQKIAALDDATAIYCAHEYTLANIQFALTVDPNNIALQQRLRQATEQRQQQQPTIPSRLDIEKASNPFLRPLNSEFNQSFAINHGIPNSPLEVFSHIRHLKDCY